MLILDKICYKIYNRFKIGKTKYKNQNNKDKILKKIYVKIVLLKKFRKIFLYNVIIIK